MLCLLFLPVQSFTLSPPVCVCVCYFCNSGAWISKMEKDGESPLKDPMALIGIGGIMIPFIILAIAGAAGYIGN